MHWLKTGVRMRLCNGSFQTTRLAAIHAHLHTETMILLHPSSSIVLRWMVLLLLGASITLVSATAPSSVTGSRLLVVTEDAQSVKSAYSQFLGDLEGSYPLSFPPLSLPSLTAIAWPGRGYEVNFQSPKDDEKKLSLLTHGERAYDHVILFPPKSKGCHPPANC